MSLIVNWKGSSKLVSGFAAAPTDSGLRTGDPSKLDADGRQLLERRELAVNDSPTDPCIWLRLADDTMAKFRPRSELLVVKTAADLPAPGVTGSPALQHGDLAVVRFAADGTTPLHRLAVFDGSSSPGAWRFDGISRGIRIVADAAARLALRTPDDLLNGDLCLQLDSHQLFRFDAPTSSIAITEANWTPLNGGLQFVARIGDLPDPATTRVANGQMVVVEMDFNGDPYRRLLCWDEANNAWHVLNRIISGKGLQSDPDRDVDNEDGDLQFTAEDGHQELKAWDAGGNQWVSIYSADQIKAWIAALNLFEGTTIEAGKVVPGAVAFDALPDLAATDPAAMASNAQLSAHYYTFVGTPGYAIKPTDPVGLGRDLSGALLNPGDWLQVVNRGTNTAPDMHWVHIGGDLLAKSRADMLYGLQPYTAGSWEKGSLVVRNGEIYRATRGVIGIDPRPGTTGNQQVATVTIPFDPARTTGRSYAVAISVDGIAQPARTFAIADGESNAQVLAKLRDWIAATYPGVLFGKDSLMPNSIDVVTIDTNKPLTVVFTGTGLADATVAVNAVAADVPWQKVPLSGGLKVAQTDPGSTAGALPASAPAGEVWLVLQSVIAGNKQGLFAYDTGTSKWQLLGGGGNKPLALSGGKELRSVGVPVGTVVMWLAAAAPPGWMFCHGQTFSQAAYPELALVFPGLTLPDLRGAYLRGAGTNGTWGSAADTVGTRQEDSTAMPKKPFSLEHAGEHTHDMNRRASRGTTQLDLWSQVSVGGNENPYWNSIGNPGMQAAGDHTHTIKGGDLETRPKSVLCEFIVKVKDQSITLVA